jgi:hypothetical protein
VTALAAEDEEIARMRVAPETLLHLQRQAVDAAAHIGDTTGEPDAHAGGKGDHRPSSAESTRASAAPSTSAPTTMRRPSPSSISMRPAKASDRTSGSGDASGVGSGATAARR